MADEIQYTALDASAQRQIISARLRDLEQQHLVVSLRVHAPDASTPPNDTDTSVLELLATSIAWCHAALTRLQPSAPAA